MRKFMAQLPFTLFSQFPYQSGLSCICSLMDGKWLAHYFVKTSCCFQIFFFPCLFPTLPHLRGCIFKVQSVCHSLVLFVESEFHY